MQVEVRCCCSTPILKVPNGWASLDLVTQHLRSSVFRQASWLSWKTSPRSLEAKEVQCWVVTWWAGCNSPRACNSRQLGSATAPAGAPSIYYTTTFQQCKVPSIENQRESEIDSSLSLSLSLFGESECAGPCRYPWHLRSSSSIKISGTAFFSLSFQVRNGGI